MSRLSLVIRFALTVVAVAAVQTLFAAELLERGGSITLVRDSQSAIAPLDSSDPSIELSETRGSSAFVRLAVNDASLVVVLMPYEQRAVRLRDVFADSVLRSNQQMTVEVIQGNGAVSVQAVQLHSAAVGARRRAVQPPAAQPSSFALIDQAEASGAIDSETALLYRVFAIVADVRLPAKYRGDDSNITDSLYLQEVRQRFASLSPATQAVVEPFLVPPAYRGSWVKTKAGASAIEIPLQPCQAPVFSDDWKSVDASNSPVRVWYRTDVLQDALYANGVAAEVDRIIWPKLTGLMHPAGATTGVPLNDEPEPCNGGNARLDIYLVDGATSFTVPYEFCSPTPAFITLVRGSDFAIVAHEIFHAIQFSYPLDSCNPLATAWWFEGSAQWSMDFVYGREHQVEQGAAYHLLNFPQKPLDEFEVKHRYATYILPFFQAGKTGSADFVKQSWLNMATNPPLEAIDKALAGGFEKVWPEFVRYNWNESPFDEYKRWDDFFLGARPEEGGPLAIGVGTPAFAISLPVELPRLSSVYHHFKIDDSVSSVIFWNGVTTKLSQRDLTGGLLGPQYVTDEANADETKGAHVTALIKLDGTWREEDWTKRPAVIYCRDSVAERIDELVLIISNSEFKDRDRKLRSPGDDPVVYTSAAGCRKWTGTATWNGTNVTTTANVTWTAASSSVLGTVYTAEGGLSWRSTRRDCTASGSAPLGFASLLVFDGLPLDNPNGRSYQMLGTGGAVNVCGIDETLTWLLTPDPEERIVRIGATGKVIEGSYAEAGGANSWTWHFDSQRE